MTKKLHITNGDCAANLIKTSNITGDVLPWRDTMHSGPFPKRLALEEASKLRAQYFSGPGVPLAETQRGFALRDNHLKAASTYDEIILWFEHDLLDQLQILQILDWLQTEDLNGTNLSLICINEYEGIIPFRGLGQLTTAQIENLIGQQKAVTQKQLTLATKGWDAFRSPDPKQLVNFISSDLSALPFLKASLERHLQEYPSVRNGLNHTQNQILKLVAKGITSPAENFTQSMNLETVFYMGDWTHFSQIGLLTNGHHPLLSCLPNKEYRYPPTFQIKRDEFLAQSLRLTKLGQEVMENKIDAVALIELDQWFGGVHLHYEQPIWRWDNDSNKLVLSEPQS